ncbi:MAG: hypothetical protein ABI612_08485 [Betaproteobacteria bacterium]
MSGAVPVGWLIGAVDCGPVARGWLDVGTGSVTETADRRVVPSGCVGWGVTWVAAKEKGTVVSAANAEQQGSRTATAARANLNVIEASYIS